MPDALIAAERQTRRLRLLFGFAVVVGGMLAAFNAALVVGALAMITAMLVPQPAVVLPLSKAALSTILAIGAFYLVARPLWRYGRLGDFVQLLERPLGRETYVLSACQLGQPGEIPSHYSRVLLAELGSRALGDLQDLKVGRTSAVRWFWLHIVLTMLLISASLVLNMRYPQTIAAASVRLLTIPEKTLVDGSIEGDGGPPKPQMEAVKRPPCNSLQLQVHPPEYLHREPFAISWNTAIRLAAGSRIEVLCHGPVEGQAVTLEARGSGDLKSASFSRTGEGTGAREYLRATMPLMEEMELYIVGPERRTQPGRVRIMPQADSAPQCRLLQPDGPATLDETDSLTLLVEAIDDHGLSGVVVRYQVEGLDDVPATIELARPADQRQAVVQRDLPLTSFGADPDDRIKLTVEVVDGNDITGPGRCRTETRFIAVHSRFSTQRDVVEQLAAERDRAIDLMAAGLLLEDSADPAAPRRFLKEFEEYAEALDSLAGRMGQSNLFKEEDARRLATLAAAVEELLPQQELEDDDLSRFAGPALREMEQQVHVVDGLVEKLLGEYLFLHAARVQRELERVVALARQTSTDAGGVRAVQRAMRRLQRAARRAVQFAAKTRPSLPGLFTSVRSRQETDWFGQVETLAGRLATSSLIAGGEDWRGELEALSRAVERAVESVEGAYAQSMTRLSSSFRNAQDELTKGLRKALILNQAVRKELEELLNAVAAETKKYIRRGKTIDHARAIARTARNLSRKARRFRADTYLKVDRSQVVEFREKLARLSELVGILKVEEASGLASDLVVLTNSMDFSLKLSIRYSKDRQLVKHSRRELEKVEEAHKLAEAIQARLSLIRPQRSKLKSLRSENLESVTARIDKLGVELSAVREKVSGLNKLFPIFFGKFGPLLDRTIDSGNQARTKLGELLLQDAHRQAIFMDENLTRLLDSLENASRNARTASALSAGGSQPAQELAGKEEVVSRERLEQYLRLSASLGENEAWEQVIGSYFEQLSP
jgi:hypothetical protein